MGQFNQHLQTISFTRTIILIMLAGINPTDSNPYSAMKESNIGLTQDCNSLVNTHPWRNPYSNPYVYDAATAVALVGYSPYAAGYSPHMDLAGRRKNATRETTATLKAWLYEHRKNPYPTKSEKVYLAIMTKMTLTQVSTWFANARRRLKKENKMTWSPRNRTTDEDDERHDCDSDEQSNPIPSSSNIPTSFQYLSPPLTVLQHHQTIDEKSLKRKFDDHGNEQQGKKRAGIWSLADMAESNPNEKKQRRSSSSSSRSSQEKVPSIVGAFKPLK